MKNIIISLLVIGIWSLVITAPAVAVPQKINFQGVLKDLLGEPVTGTKTIAFSIYDVATGGTALWTETQLISVEAGLYSVRLGDVSSLPLSVFSGDTRYLGISIDSSELSPRTVIISVPFAYRAAVADAYESGGVASDVVRFGVDESTTQTTSGAYAIRLRTTAEEAKTIYATSEGSASRSIYAYALGSNSIGIYGAASGSGDSYGIYGRASGSAKISILGETNVDNGYGVIGVAHGTGGHGVYANAYGVDGVGMEGYGSRGGMYGSGSNFGGSFEASGNGAIGVYASSRNSSTKSWAGYFKQTSSGGASDGIYVTTSSDGGSALLAESTGAGGKAIYGFTDNSTSYSGYFTGGMGLKLPEDNSASAPAAGTIRWSGTKFQGYTGTVWVDFH